jgi:hypothetical protein
VFTEWPNSEQSAMCVASSENLRAMTRRASKAIHFNTLRRKEARHQTGEGSKSDQAFALR